MSSAGKLFFGVPVQLPHPHKVIQVLLHVPEMVYPSMLFLSLDQCQCCAVGRLPWPVRRSSHSRGLVRQSQPVRTTPVHYVPRRLREPDLFLQHEHAGIAWPDLQVLHWDTGVRVWNWAELYPVHLQVVPG